MRSRRHAAIRPAPALVAAGALSFLFVFPEGSGIAFADSPSSLTTAEYRTLIDSGWDAVDASKRDTKATDTLRSQLQAVRTVTAPDGSTVSVDTTTLVEALDPGAADTETSWRFASLDIFLPGDEKPLLLPPGDPQAQAKTILSGSEFAIPKGEADDTAPGWWNSFKRWIRETGKRISDWLNKSAKKPRPPLMPPSAGAPLVAQFFVFLLYFLLGVAALVAVYFLVRSASARGWLRKRQKRSDTEPGLDLDLTAEEIADPLAAAKALAARGEYRDGVRLAYIASLRRLEENGLLQREANRTNWEYQRALRRRSRKAHDTLLPATRLFDRVWYGRRPATEAEFNAVVAVHDTLPSTPQSAIADPDAGGSPYDSQEEEALRP